MTTTALAPNARVAPGDRSRMVALLAAALNDGSVTPAQISALPDDEALSLVAAADQG